MKYADVILPLALPKNFTYSIPDELEEDIKPGCRVAVQFGKNKKYAAIVKAIHQQKPEAYSTKPILYLLEKDPVVNPNQLKFWEWIAKYYMCTEGDVMHAALPAHLKLTSETRLIFNPVYGEDLTDLNDDEYLVAEALQIKKELTIEEVQKILSKIQVYAVVKQLLDKKVCFVYEELKEAYKPKEEKVIHLHPDYDDEEKYPLIFEKVKQADKQQQAFLAFLHLKKTKGLVFKKELQEKAGVSSAVVNALADKNIFVIEKQIVDRIPHHKGEINIDFTLNEEQQKGYDQILHFFKNKQTVLLHGITSSGKTMIYIRLIEDFLRKGKQVLYLLPEIALTAQIVRRLQKHFGNQIGIYHSRFSNNERVEIWNKVKTGEYKVVLGARSALLLPFKDLGLIVVDEEHDASYKQQDPAPRYHARDAALYYAGLFGAKALLGSATPSLESYYNAQQGKYGLVTLSGRYGGVKMPEIEIVDMKQVASKKGGINYVSPQLKAAIQQAVSNDKQVILFQNRRGYAPMIICSACGWIPRCKNCDVSLTYHKYHHRLHCHYCGQQYPVPEICEACGNATLINRSFGTERIEEDLVTLFPKMRIARMDWDAVRNKEAHHKLISLFEQRRIDILAGTQMVVKGLDFDHVHLVGILSADSLLSYPDFRLHERAFQLLEQVSGRSGRREESGKVILQAINITHPLLNFVIRHDYEGFYQTELEERKRFDYPPFSRLIRVELKHRKQEVVHEAASVLSQALQPYFHGILLGPAVPTIGRVRNYYLVEFLIKLPRNSGIIDKAKKVLREKFNWLQSQKNFRGVVIIPDVDCV